MPAGFFLPILFPKQNTFIRALKVGFLLTLAIEALQLLLSLTLIHGRYKIFDVDDLILNTLGFMIGFLLVSLVIQWLPRLSERVKK